MIPLIKQRMLELGYLTVTQINDIIAISEMTPGPFTINSATFVGVKTAGIIGGVCATLGIAITALFYGVVVAKFYFKLKGGNTFENILRAIRPASTAMITVATVSMLIAAVNNSFLGLNFDIGAILIAIAVFVLIKKFKVSPILCLVLSGIIGMLIY